MATDVKMQIGLGRFFADKFRAGTLFAIYEQSGDRTALEESLKLYRRAREQWSTLANSVATVYKKDVTAGETAHLRGHWLDRLPAIDEDIAEMKRLFDATAPTTTVRPPNIVMAVSKCLEKPKRVIINAQHQPQKKFTKGKDIALEITLAKKPKAVVLHYRHINHAERYNSIEMKASGSDKYVATIPASYTDSPYPLAYYFEIKETPGVASIYPGLGKELKDQPYFVMRQV
jgi:hypothetical protein